MERLNSHPGETGEQGVMHESCDKHTHPVWLDCGPPLRQQEGGIEQKQGPTQRHVNGNGAILVVVSEKEKKCIIYYSVLLL